MDSHIRDEKGCWYYSRGLIAALSRSQNHEHGTSFHAGALLNNRNILKVFGNQIKELLCNLRVVDFTTPKADTYLHLHPIGYPFTGSLDFEHPVVIRRLWTQADLFDLNHLLLFTGFALFLCLLVLELAKVHNSTDGRLGVRRNLYQIEISIAGTIQSFTDRDNHVVTRLCNQANLTDADLLINAIC